MRVLNYHHFMNLDIRHNIKKYKIKIIILTTLFAGLALGYSMNLLTQKVPEYKLLQIRNNDKTVSFVRTVDINNDGSDEIVYEPRSSSWYNKTFILKGGEDNNPFALFCSNCQFETYASSPEFKDLNNDGLLDIRLPEFVDSANNYQRSRDVIYFFNGKDYIKQ